MKRLIYGSLLLGLVFANQPIQAQTMKKQSTSIPVRSNHEGGGPTYGSYLKTDDPINNRTKASSAEALKDDSSLPYYKTHGEGRKYLGRRP